MIKMQTDIRQLLQKDNNRRFNFFLQCTHMGNRRQVRGRSTLLTPEATNSFFSLLYSLTKCTVLYSISGVKLITLDR